MLARRADELRTGGRAPRLADLGRLVGRERRPAPRPPAPTTRLAVKTDGALAPTNGRTPSDAAGPAEPVTEAAPTARVPR
jgi:hypothetical protein